MYNTNQMNKVTQKFDALESVMCDIIKISLNSSLLWVSYPTSPLMPPFSTYFMTLFIASKVFLKIV